MTPASGLTHVTRNCHDTLIERTIMPMTGKGTARQTFRYDPAKWERVGEMAAAAGTDRTALIRDFLDWMLSEPNAPEPAKLDGHDPRSAS